jgi:hypothetical protein
MRYGSRKMPDSLFEDEKPAKHRPVKIPKIRKIQFEGDEDWAPFTTYDFDYTDEE